MKDKNKKLDLKMSITIDGYDGGDYTFYKNNKQINSLKELSSDEQEVLYDFLQNICLDLELNG